MEHFSVQFFSKTSYDQNNYSSDTPAYLNSIQTAFQCFTVKTTSISISFILLLIYLAYDFINQTCGRNKLR